MEIRISDWYDCPCRQEVNPKKKFIKSHRYFHEDHYTEYADGICTLAMSSEENLSCPTKSRTHKAYQLVGDAPLQCPLRKDSITLKTGFRFGAIVYR